MATRDHCPPSLRPQGSVQLLPGSAGIQMYIYINKIDPLERDKRVVVQSSSNFFLPVFSSAFCRLFARLIRKINPKESGKVRTHNAIFITSDNIFGICWDVHLAPHPLNAAALFYGGRLLLSRPATIRRMRKQKRPPAARLDAWICGALLRRTSNFYNAICYNINSCKYWRVLLCLGSMRALRSPH